MAIRAPAHEISSIARIVFVGAILVLIGMRDVSASETPSWEGLLAPYSRGTPLPDGFRIAAVCYGVEHDVVIEIERPDDGATIEVHVVPRGRWKGVQESRSFGIGYEVSRSPAAERASITALLAETIRSRDQGLPAPDTIALGPAFEGSICAAMRSNVERLDFLERSPRVRALQIAWAMLILTAPLLCWRAARVTGVAGVPVLLVIGISVALALAATWYRADEPLHANGHAWREAREVLAPWGERERGAAPFLHGRGGIALQWLIARVERTFTGTADPFRISRLGIAAAAGATALLTTIVIGSPWAGLAAGAVLAGLPLAQMLAVSGSALAIPAAILPWSLALLIAARRANDVPLLAGATLAAALGTMSHTAMLAWPAAVTAAWLVTPRRALRATRVTWFACGALVIIGAAWWLQLADCRAMLEERNQGTGLLRAAEFGFLRHNLMLDPHWVSPVLPAFALLGFVVAFSRRLDRVGAALLVSVIGWVPFFTVHICSSDAVRYQGALLGLVAAIAVTGVWALPLSRRLPLSVVTVLGITLLATMVLLPASTSREPMDPAAVEHRLVVEGARRIQEGTLVVLPKERFDQVIVDFPDFLLPDDSRVAFEGDPEIEAYEGPRLAYLGLACISWSGPANGSDSTEVRPECRALRSNARPWLVRSLRVEDLPRGRDGAVWTFHPLATDVPFGFFVLD